MDTPEEKAIQRFVMIGMRAKQLETIASCCTHCNLCKAGEKAKWIIESVEEGIDILKEHEISLLKEK